LPVARVDLYLGGEFGLWALGRVAPSDVRRVFTSDPRTLEAARALGLDARDDAADSDRRDGDADARGEDLRSDDAGTRGDNERSDDAGARSDDANARGDAPAVFGFSVHYPRIIRPPLLTRYRKIYNLHPGYLPWGRGFYPVFWALWEGTPAGATLHEMSEGLDEGPVVAQTRVPYDEDDTGGSLHARVREAERQLFLEYWPRVARGEELPAHPQAEGAGTRHARREFFALKESARVEALSGPQLLRLARCLTFPGHTGLEVTLGRAKFELRLEPLARTDDANERTT
jgi:Formyl transferase